MKATIPDNIKAELPQTAWGKVLGMTPIFMTVIATMLAGIASSEMTRAQYDRALGAQLQSKAGDQWGYFQAKKLRGALQQNSLEVLQATMDVPELDTTGISATLTSLSAPGVEQTMAALEKSELPPVSAATAPKPAVQAAMDALGANRPETEIFAALTQVSDADLEDAMTQAKAQSMDFDTAVKPVNSNLDHLEKLLSKPGADKGPLRGFTAARLRFGTVRYDNEARLNQVVGGLYELQVRKANASADRHHARSKQFFYGMLLAQMGVIISTFAIASRQKSLLWSLAAAAGLLAVSMSAYVFLRV